jgi:hypothetical protein
VRAGLVAHQGDWPWSSYRATVGEDHAPTYLAVGAVLSMFRGPAKRGRRGVQGICRGRTCPSGTCPGARHCA